MIDLATLFQAASEEHAAAVVPGFPVSGKADPEEQVSDNKEISGVSGVSGPSEFPEQSAEFYETQARARGRAGERARGSYVGEPETPETPEKRVPAGDYLSGSLSLKPEKKRETGKAASLPAPSVGLEPPTFDERAAFLEYECGLSRAEAEAQARAETTIIPDGKNAPAPTADGLAIWRAGLARLDYETAPCPGYRSDEWRSTLARAVAFLDQFGEQAEALGWTASRLFGVHETAGIVRVDACGALTLPVSEEVRAITDREVRFDHLTHREKPGQPQGVPWWEFGR
ncbi:hypothetical protein SAMN05216360_1297 [Methylobacterium phyllostachyos]|uniref:Uncharacterized protein n=1 Tax=Methylobacterium phyllostachyos TaxID=582672 RepID=A0A1H0KT66_9HYPH|nr:hypothetical protein [Methylobacterium phyllostachyos]SDO59158.1 hypothetical protein SAMN05216360_1297 [Methylobacterium phyllostachyos]